jgi:hypothetical protein
MDPHWFDSMDPDPDRNHWGSATLVCRLGEEFDELTADGRKVKSKMTLQRPNVMVHEMKGTEGGKDSGRSPRVELRGRG